ncbi:protein odr-4 homolog [Amphibalanus amphitrite]|uniref:protein odr-4 homolog n=1 Tax=Amphibalanus amphitrite TaxID=1232801 RepID=UPI001C905EBC|nr:protein odr-4 homolog [Amphibalanus amphitrite]
MGRTVVAEKYLESEVKTLVGSGAKYGLIIGQNTTGRAVVAHLCCTPPSEAASDSPVNDSWIAKHAKQVIQLLPGGMDILGLFVVASPDLFKSHETQLRSALTAIYRALEKLPQLHDTETDERLVALLDPRTKKVTCRSLELSSLTSSLRPAEWRFQEVRWHRAQSALSVQVTAGVGVLAAETSLLRQVMTSLEPFLSSLADASCLVDGKLVDGDALLSGDDEKPGKSAGKTFAFDLLYDTTKTPPSEQLLEPVEAVIRINGRIHCLAYLPPRPR